MSNRKESELNVFILFISITGFIIGISTFLYLIIGANVVYVADKTPSEEFNDDYIKQENIKVSQHGFLSKFNETDKLYGSIIVDYSGNYEYRNYVYTISQEREPIHKTLKRQF